MASPITSQKPKRIHVSSGSPNMRNSAEAAPAGAITDTAGVLSFPQHRYCKQRAEAGGKSCLLDSVVRVRTDVGDLDDRARTAKTQAERAAALRALAAPLSQRLRARPCATSWTSAMVGLCASGGAAFCCPWLTPGVAARAKRVMASFRFRPAPCYKALAQRRGQRRTRSSIFRRACREILASVRRQR
jgi:hypothetical protein